jgi:hypothetical protein
VPAILKGLAEYAKTQLANNLPTIITGVAVGVGGLIDKTKLPQAVKTLIKGSLAATLSVLTHNSASPANPAHSIVQRTLRGGEA